MATTTPPAPPRTLDRVAADAAPGSRPGRRPWAALSAHLPRRGGDAVVLAPLLAIAAVLMRVGLTTAPQRIDDEGTYVAQAWAVLHLGELTHYTYWYDHPPLGWLQIALWTGATDGFGRAPNAVAAGRELMLVLTLVAAALLWVLARRLGLPRWAAAVAVVAFTVSPLAVQFHRTVYLDNIATVWVLASFVLVLSPRRRLGAFAGAAVCLAVAVLTKETSLLMAPVLAALLWQRSRGDTRRYAIAVSASLFTLVLSFYVLFAALKAEVLPGSDHTSLVTGVLYQLGGRAGSGSIFTPGTLGNKTVGIWLQLDTVLPVLAVVATVFGLALRRLRPIAVAMLILLVMLVRPGYLPVPFVIAMLPLGAVLVGGVAAGVWQHRPQRLSRLTGAVAVVLAVAVVGTTAPAWGSQLRGLTQADLDAPMTQATAWVGQHVPRGDRILTDDAIWVDLVEQGRDPGDVVWFYKPDSDPAVPAGWQSYQWVVSTNSVRSDPSSFPTLDAALTRSRAEVVFGTGVTRVEVRRVAAADPVASTPAAPVAPADSGAAPVSGPDAQRVQAAAAAGRQLVENPQLTLAGPARSVLTAGQADPRLLIVLAAMTATRALQVADLPRLTADPAAARRVLVVTAIDGRPVVTGTPAVDDVLQFFARQPAGYRPTARVTGDAAGGAVLTVTFPPS